MKHAQPDSIELHLPTDGGARSLRAPRSHVSLAPIDISSIVDLLRRRSRLIGATAFALAALAMGYSLLTPPSYVSSASIMVDPRGLQIVENEVAPQGGDQQINSAVVDTHMSILTSDPVLAEVADQLGLVNVPEYDPTLTSPLASLLGTIRSFFEEDGEAKADDYVLAMLRNRLRVVRLPGSYVLKLYVQARHPELAQEIASTVVSVYLAREVQTRREVSRRSVEALLSRIDDLRIEVEAAEDAVERYKAEHGIVAASGQLITDQQLSAVNQQFVLARARADELSSRYRQVEAIARSGQVPDSLPESVQSATISQLRGQYAQARQAEANLRAKLGPRHPALVSAVGRSDQVRQEIADELHRIAESVRSEHQRAAATAEALQKQIAASTAEANQVNEGRIELRQLEREAEATRAVFESFLGRSREINEQRDVETSNSRVISPASMPLKAEGPSTSIILAGALAFGLGLGAGLALLRDLTDGRVHSAGQLLERTGLAVIGAISAAQLQKLNANDPDAASNGACDGKTGHQKRADRQGRATLTALSDFLEETPHVSTGHATVVAAIDEEEAAAILAEGLARFEVGRGKSVLLANNTHPALFMREPHHSSHTDELAGSFKKKSVRITKQPVTAGSLKEAADGVDHVLVAAPPIVDDEEIRALTAAAGGLVIALRLHQTRFQDIEHARAILGPQVDKVVGAVLIDGGRA